MSGVSDGAAAPDDDCAPGRSSAERRRLIYGTAWLVFLAFPLIDAVTSHRPIPIRALIVVAASVFTGVYLAQLFAARRTLQGRVVTSRTAATMVATQIVIAVALTITDRPSWAAMFIFTIAGSAVVLRGRLRRVMFVACVVLTPLTGVLGGDHAGSVIAYSATTVGVGMLMLALADLRVRNEELSAARAELARLAVAEERERFGRDLHDLLGHSLSVIALKAELAGRLLPAQPGEASSEVAEIETVARQALREVREAVSDYRRPTLGGELAGARMALSAAGIEADVHRDAVSLEPGIEAVLAWAVREGATNVIRHSRAGTCQIRIAANLVGATAEVIDDGVGTPGDGPNADAGNGGAGGTGLMGLAERARVLGGAVQAGSIPEGGFRLAVSVPVGR